LYIHISSSISSFDQTFFPAMFAVLLSTHALDYTGFPGLVHVAAESKCGTILHGHRKCSQAGCPLVNCDPGESALEGGYTLESMSPEKQRGTCAIFTLTCNPTFTLAQLKTLLLFLPSLFIAVLQYLLSR
jgi:hypothetical protein